MMISRRQTNSRPVVRFNEVIQFDDEDRGCLSDGDFQVVRAPLSSMEQSRWLPTSPPESPKNQESKVMSLDTKRKLMKELGLSCPPMPPRLPTRWPSNSKDLDKMATTTEKSPSAPQDIPKKISSPAIDSSRKYYRIYRS